MRADALTRELAKALEALRWTEKHLMATNEGNAALHCNPKVFYSPLTTQVHEAVLSLQRVVEDLDNEAPASDSIPVASHLEAGERAQQEIERLRATVARACALADRWQAAHGSAMFLVRAAGAELRDELDGATEETHIILTADLSNWERAFARVRRDPRADDPSYDLVEGDGTGRPVGLLATLDATGDDMDDVRQHYTGPAAEPCTKHRGRAERQRYGCNGPDPADQGPPNQGPLTGIEVRDPCPYCEDCRLIPRALMDDHVREHHPEATVTVRLDNSAARFTPRPDGGIAEDGLRKRCEELHAQLDDAEDRAHTAVRNAEAADRVRAEAQRDRDQHAAVLREVLDSFDRVASVPDGRILGYQGKTIDPEQFERWRSVVAPTVERPWWEQLDEMRAALARVRGIPHLPHDSQQTGELGRAYTRGWESVISAIGTALDESKQPAPAADKRVHAPHEQYRFATTWAEYHAGRKALDKTKEG